MEYVRIAILSPYDVFLGAMDNEAEDSLHYYDDELIEYLKGTASTFSCKVNAQHEDSRHLVEGNKLSFRYQNKDYYLNIMHVERDEYEVYIEAYTLSFELLNEKRSAYKASTAMSFEEYLEVFDPEHVVSLGLNEVSDKKIIHEWTGEETILGRLFSLATVFSVELEFLPRLNDNYSLKQIVMNAYKEHSDTVQGVGRDRTDLVLRYNKQISGIKKTSDITELYTAITPTGRDGLTLASLDKTEYDSEGKVEYRKPAGSTHLYAVQARDRFPSNLMAAENERYIGVDWEYDTDNVNTLYGQALAQLKKNCVPQVSYEVEGYFDTGIGDTVIIADEDFNPELYLQARVTEQHRSFTDPTQNKTTFDNFKELQSQIDESLLSRVEELIAQGKTYTAMISTDNGIVFRNGIGETTMTAHVRDAGGVELADNYEIHWLKDGAEVYIGNPYTITANDVEGKAVYRFEAVDTSGTVKAFYEVTVSDVSDGGKGDPGEDGRSVVSVREEYYLSTSKTELIGGEWTEIPPTWTKGTYLWKRTKYVYENPPGTEYTIPICDSSWEAANDVADDLHNNYYNKTETEAKIQVASESITSTVKTTVTEEIEKIEIGGRNLLKNSSLRVDTNEWETDPSTTSNVTVSQTEKDNNTCTLIDSSTLSTSDYHFWQNLDVGKLELNGTYTASLWILAENVSKSNAGGTAACQFEITNAQTSGVDLHYHQKVLDNGYADWTKLSWTFTVTNATLTTASTIYFGLYLKNTTGDFYIRDLQLEKGSIATDWTPAPEDLATSEAVQNVQTTADNANSVATSTESRVTVAESTIQQLSDAISSLVVDENGESMMTQTSDGWRFEMGSINSQLNEAKDQLNELSGEMTQADETISNLNDLANDLSEKTAYITMTTDEEGNPCIELGKSDNEFKVRITNTSIDFMQGGLKMAYFSNNSLYIEKAIIKNELQIGEGNGFIWKTRSNGHLGLRYVEGVSS